MHPNRWAVGIVGLLACSLTVGCSPSGGDSSSGGGGSYKVGLVLDQTGVSAQIAGPTGAGVRAYIEQLNKSGGINGRKIDIVKQADSRSTPEGAQAAFQEVLQNSPVAVLGSINSLGIAAVVPVASGANTPLLIGGAVVLVALLVGGGVVAMRRRATAGDRE